MKIYTNIEYEWDGEQYVEVASESYEYSGDVALAKGGGQTVQKTDTSPWVGQQPYLKDLFGLAQGYQQTGIPDTSASQAYTEQAIQQLGTAGQQMNPYVQALQQANQGYATGDLLDVNNNPALQGYLDAATRQIMQQYTDVISPGITGQAAAVGGIGSSRQGIAEGLAAGRTQQAVGDTTAQILNSAYGQGLNATMQAQGLSPAIARMMTLPANVTQQQAGLQYGLDTENDQAALARLEAYKNLIGGGGYGGSSTTTGPATQTGGVAGALGGAAAGAGIVGALTAEGMASASWAGPAAPWIVGGSALLGAFG